MNVRWEATNLTTLSGSTVLGLWIALALISAVAAGVAGYVSLEGRGGPNGIELVLAIGGACTVVFGALAWLSFQRSRARVRLGWDGSALRLEIAGPRGASTHTGPFQIVRGWMTDAVATGRGSIPVKVVMLAVLDEQGTPLLYLREQLGAIYPVPTGWPQRVVTVQGCPHVYTNSLGRLELDRLAVALGGRDA